MQQRAHSSVNSILNRAQLYLCKSPPAISGNGGHNATFRVACKLVEFGLGRGEAWQLLCEWNRTCLPPWSEAELRHKLSDAFRTARPASRVAFSPSAISLTKIEFD